MIGSASGNIGSEVRLAARELGRAIAKNNLVLFSGACLGLPLEATLGAKEVGGNTVGVSPAINLKEHIEEYKYPSDVFDSIIFTGSGYKGRNVTLVRSCDSVISVQGMIGTLNELTIAYDEKKIVGLLLGTGGASDLFIEVLKKMGKPTDNVISSDDPNSLIEKIIEALDVL
ncbi:MAG: hypothetical protein APG12_00733 [Candidatus Methanofastidiosum methylothiophilum]|uniref:Lysine decarboxylase n=1 Tax=Candidatus Methanofastidiosum methylothiophilum TaxID=1705564 RepID=A0A150IHC0_9EURY|nr:MAG: hypothetical protein APG10_01795 [Candidatus Methanofastidiosum methylthiophilus]KYC47981.1 MAG: hypothetical protein APG11_00756 [Candidatus Methanofastidiosum methylthiophilus]KYC50599.1 MAG: hypothetical protein APG12_00733 [Candidatus Methanofastidiosum methylthiophilus]